MTREELIAELEKMPFGVKVVLYATDSEVKAVAYEDPWRMGDGEPAIVLLH